MQRTLDASEIGLVGAVREVGTVREADVAVASSTIDWGHVAENAITVLAVLGVVSIALLVFFSI